MQTCIKLDSSLQIIANIGLSKIRLNECENNRGVYFVGPNFAKICRLALNLKHLFAFFPTFVIIYAQFLVKNSSIFFHFLQQKVFGTKIG